MPAGLANFFASASICTASSRVGAMTSIRGEPDRRSFMILAQAGNRNPSVLPEPVLATPMRSRPITATGQAYCWMGLGAWKPAWSMGCTSCCGKPWIEEKDDHGGGICPLPLTVMSGLSAPVIRLLVCAGALPPLAPPGCACSAEPGEPPIWLTNAMACWSKALAEPGMDTPGGVVHVVSLVVVLWKYWWPDGAYAIHHSGETWTGLFGSIPASIHTQGQGMRSV
mmetsp:Transcript_67158/g.205655  ORF Transcript_67158/g.205655 Transcript_67158/m.205655 type:complete len:225 (-) Transcript_67158:13-687(-)